MSLLDEAPLDIFWNISLLGTSFSEHSGKDNRIKHLCQKHKTDLHWKKIIILKEANGIYHRLCIFEKRNVFGNVSVLLMLEMWI